MLLMDRLGFRVFAFLSALFLLLFEAPGLEFRMSGNKDERLLALFIEEAGLKPKSLHCKLPGALESLSDLDKPWLPCKTKESSHVNPIFLRWTSRNHLRFPYCTAERFRCQGIGFRVWLDMQAVVQKQSCITVLRVIRAATSAVK